MIRPRRLASIAVLSFFVGAVAHSEDPPSTQSDLMSPLGSGYLQNQSSLLEPPRPQSASSNSRSALCDQARQFRDHELFSLWDAQQQKYSVLTDGSNAMVKLRINTATLLDKETWVGSTGADIAIEIKGFTDAMNDVVALFVPEGQIMNGAFHHAKEIADGTTSIGVLTTYAKQDAEAAAKQSLMELWARYGGQIGQATKLLADAADYAKNKQDASQYRLTVVEQVTKINNAIQNLNAQRRDAVRKMDGYQEVVQAIDMICENKRPADSPLMAANSLAPESTGIPTAARCQALAKSPAQGSCEELKYCARQQAQICVQWLQQNRAALADPANRQQGQMVRAVLETSNRIASSSCAAIQSTAAAEKASTIVIQ
jgi:hypothetical protein